MLRFSCKMAAQTKGSQPLHILPLQKGGTLWLGQGRPEEPEAQTARAPDPGLPERLWAFLLRQPRKEVPRAPREQACPGSPPPASRSWKGGAGNYPLCTGFPGGCPPPPPQYESVLCRNSEGDVTWAGMGRLRTPSPTEPLGPVPHSARPLGTCTAQGRAGEGP